MLTTAFEEQKQALRRIQGPEWQEIGPPYCKGAKARRLPGGAIDVDLSSADLIDRRDRSGHVEDIPELVPPVRLGGVQTIQRVMRRAEQ